MAMRLSGLMSGMDTESIIQDLVAVKRKKVEAEVKAQTKLEWKQDIWKDLNKRIKGLQSKYISNMRFESAYRKRTSKISNPTVADIITGKDAVNSVQTLQVKQLAKTAYLTGSVVKGTDGKEVTALSKLSDLGITGSGKINISAGNKSIDIEVNADTTISDFLGKVKEAGLNANFDQTNQRFFISAKESGVENDFSLTASDVNATTVLSELGLQTGFTDADWNDPNSSNATIREYKEFAAYYVTGDRTATLANMQSLIDSKVNSEVDSYLKQYKDLIASKENAEKKIADLDLKYTDSPLGTVESYTTKIEDKNKQIEDKNKEINSIQDPEAKKKAGEELTKLKDDLKKLQEEKTDVEAYASNKDNLAKINDKLIEVESYITVTKNDDGSFSTEATTKLISEIEDNFYNKAEYASKVVANPSLVAGGSATKINAQNAIIVLNGATFEKKDNVFEINGLTITALNETKENENVTITTQDDVDGIYDMVRDFLKEYNAIINDIDKLYNADVAKDYEPLTEEEKESMSESEIEKYEKKIKDSLLRRDGNLLEVGDILRKSMAAGVEVDGKLLYLHDFGINQLGYFNAPDHEKNAYHINGDEKDDNTAGNPDALKSLISNDPDKVIKFFGQLSRNLYSEMDNLSKSVNGFRTTGNFYDDKKMKSDYNNYKTKIAEMEKKLAAYEDKWYAKFAAMESAMAKMQNNSNAVTSMIGGF